MVTLAGAFVLLAASGPCSPAQASQSPAPIPNEPNKERGEPCLNSSRVPANPLIELFRETAPYSTLFGLSVASLGDNDGDGEEEIAIGAPAAWTDAGRTGAVLIIGAKSGRLLHTIPGPRHDAHFAWSLRSIRSSTSKTTLLAIEDGQTIRMIDPTNWKMVGEEDYPRKSRSLEFDYDGDEVIDVMREPGEADSELVIVSGARRGVLRRLPLDTVRGPDLWRMSTLAADFDGDGRKDLAIVWPDFQTGTSQIFMFTGRDLGKRRAIWLGSTVGPRCNPQALWRDLYTCGDLNGDGCEDLLAAETMIVWGRLTCYSGANGSILWKADDVVDEEYTSVDRLGDVDGDGVNDVISGRVQCVPSCGVYGFDGMVFVVSGKAGRIVHEFEEQNYPSISLEHYLALHGK